MSAPLASHRMSSGSVMNKPLPNPNFTILKAKMGSFLLLEIFVRENGEKDGQDQVDCHTVMGVRLQVRERGTGQGGSALHCHVVYGRLGKAMEGVSEPIGHQGSLVSPRNRPVLVCL